MGVSAFMSLRSVRLIGTANFIEVELRGLRPDVAVIATRGRDSPAQMSIDNDDRADLAAFADEIHACAPETRVVVPTHLLPMAL
jgi:hypothetical protein